MSGDSRDPDIPTEDAVIPPPPPESAVPDAVIPPPPPESAVPDAVIPPPPPESAVPDAVIPPPPPESAVPDVVIPPPPPESAVPDVVIPPPPPEAMVPATRRSRPKPAILEGDGPAPVADDWAQPSIAPEVPTSGGYRALTFVIFAFLLLLLAAAIAGAVYLGTHTTLGSAADLDLALTAASLAVASPWRG